MIPGQRVGVALFNYCLPVEQEFRLLKVEVEETPEGEQIGIELGTLNLTGDP